MTETKRVVASAAQQLLGYMTFRARREGQPHELPLEYYQEHLDQGVRTFFGVVTGPDGLEADLRQPEMFEEWKKNGRPGSP
jgi:hypothetical protein